MPTMRRVFEARLIESQHLSIDDFQRECFYKVSLDTLETFKENAGLIVYVGPSEAASCRRWFVECSKVLENSSTAQDLDLVNVTRYIWRKRPNPELCYDFTLEAARRLSDEYKETLSRAL
jgi:hypothetical protein